MGDSSAQFRTVAVSGGEPRFAFHVDVPAEWVQADIPAEEPDYSEEAFHPLAVFAARYGLMVLTVSVRPAFEQGAVAEWLTRLAVREGIDFTDIGPAQAGTIQGVGGTGTQQSQAGTLIIRVVLFEQGGWAHSLVAMAPAAVWDSLAPLYDRMFDSFAMDNVLPATVRPWPDQDASQGANRWELEQAREAAEAFLQAIQRGDEAAARALLSEDDGSVNFPSMGGAETSFELGPVQADGDKAVVPATLRALPPGETQVQEQIMPLVLVQVDAQWKVDMNASIERMFGGDFMQGMQDMARELGEGLAEGMKNLAQGLGEAFGKAMGEGDTPEDPDQNKP